MDDVPLHKLKCPRQELKQTKDELGILKKAMYFESSVRLKYVFIKKYRSFMLYVDFVCFLTFITAVINSG